MAFLQSTLADSGDMASLPGSPVSALQSPMDHRQTILSLVELLLRQHETEIGGAYCLSANTCSTSFMAGSQKSNIVPRGRQGPYVLFNE